MHVGRHVCTTRVLGAPWSWDKAKQGNCGSLPIYDVETTAGPGMESAWIPTPEEVQRIIAGAPILLMVLGRMHPPVSMTVGVAPKEGTDD